MTPVTPNMASSPLSAEFQAWSFDKAMVEAQQRSPSESSSADFFDAEERMRITPNIVNMEELKRNIEEQKSPTTFNERYMSSEEALSPTEHEGDDSGVDDASIYEAETASAIKFGICGMAVAICIISVGKAKVVDLPVPSLTSSPSIGSESSIPERKDSREIPAFLRKPILRERNPARPAIRAQHSATSFADLSILKTSHSPSTSIEKATSHSISIFRSFTEQAYTPTLFQEPQPSFLSQDPYEGTARPRPQHSRLRNLSQKISRFAMYGPTKQTDVVNFTQESPAPAAKLRKVSTGLRRNSIHRASPEPITPDTGFSSMPKRKMVPRGAAERAPPPEIPPCPYDIGEDGDLIVQDRLRRRKSMIGF